MTTPAHPQTARPLATREVDVALRDGRTVHVRPVRLEDEPAVERFLAGLSVEARAARFFTAAPDLHRAAAVATHVDYLHAYGVIALVEGEIVGHGCFVATDEHAAEVAFEVADEWQGTGIGAVLLAQIVDAAKERGIESLTASVLPSNHKMLEVFRRSGLQTNVRTEPGELIVEMAASLEGPAQDAFAERDRRASAVGVGHVLEPASVALVGASEREGSIGRAILENLLAMSFAGTLRVVNHRADTVLGLPAHRSLSDLNVRPELVVIAVPAPAVLDVAREAAELEAKALVVVSAGFAEAGPEGRRREDELLAICRAAGMRLVGPNGLGVINTDPRIGLDASFAPSVPPTGNVALLSQSGALGIGAIEMAGSAGIGLSSFVSVGNMADLSVNDFLQFWEGDERTGVVMLYLESVRNPRQFSRIAQRVGRRKPVVLVKSGRSHTGARAAQSHTGALLAASDATVDALCTQAGMIRVDTISELFDTAALLAHQPAPRGRRVAILTNGGGIGILCADACEAAGLDVVGLSPALRAALADEASEGASLANPVDLLGTGRTDEFVRAASTIADSGEVDSLIVLAVGTPATDAREVAGAMDALSHELGGVVTLATVLMPRVVCSRAAGCVVPRFAFPEQAAKALSRAARHGAWRAAPPHVAPQAPPGVHEQAAALIATALKRGGGWLNPSETRRLLELHGIPFLPAEGTTDPAEARAIADRLGYPVAIKGFAPGLVHKSDAGAVKLGLADGQAVEDAAELMGFRLAGEGFEDVTYVVQKMAGSGVELLVGAVHDPTFGPVVVCAAGGTTAEILADSATRLAPLDRALARGMLRELRTFPLLRGYRGTPACDMASLEDVLVRVSGLADAHPEVAELDLNPLIAGPRGAQVADVRVRVAQRPRDEA